MFVRILHDRSVSPLSDLVLHSIRQRPWIVTHNSSEGVCVKLVRASRSVSSFDETAEVTAANIPGCTTEFLFVCLSVSFVVTVRSPPTYPWRSHARSSASFLGAEKHLQGKHTRLTSKTERPTNKTNTQRDYFVQLFIRFLFFSFSFFFFFFSFFFYSICPFSTTLEINNNLYNEAYFVYY